MNRSTKQKIRKETQTLNDTKDQLYLIYIYRIFHPKTMNLIFWTEEWSYKNSLHETITGKNIFKEVEETLIEYNPK